MRRAQISVEFAIVFAGLLILFVSVASLAPRLIRESSQSTAEAEAFLMEVKLYAIAASVSTQEYEVLLDIPAQFSGEFVTIEINGIDAATGRDDSQAVMQTVGPTPKVLSRIDLPTIESVTLIEAANQGKIRIRNTGTGVEVQL